MATGQGVAPELHVIAGSNGSGKSTLYERELQHRLPGVPFVNADNLAREHYGHAAETREEAETGQRLANERRDALLSQRADLITETTFSHPSKLGLLRHARSLGYQLVVYQVGVRSADLAVERVALRVAKGGHPVPEDKTRSRWTRSQPLIRDAVRMADRAYVYDNSSQDQPHRMALLLRSGQLAQPPGINVPSWVGELYKQELRGYAPKVLNPAAHSFREAKLIGKGMLGQAARIYIAKPGGTYTGDVLANTALHSLQLVGAASAVAHFQSRLERVPQIGSHVQVSYQSGQSAQVTTLERGRAGTQTDAVKAEAFKKLPPGEAVRLHPELADAYALVSAFSAYMDVSGHPASKAIVGAFQARLQRCIHAGEPLPKISIAQAALAGVPGKGPPPELE